MSSYKFRKATNEEISELERSGFCKFCSVYGSEATDEKFTLFFGKLITLFGEPYYTTDDYEEMYSYWIIAENGQDKIYFEVYHGASGAAVGSKYIDKDSEQGKLYAKVANELIEFIESAKPSDYEWEGIYEDIPVKVKYAVKNGVAFNDYDWEVDYE